MLLEMAVADAYGMGFEFEPLSKVYSLNRGRQYTKHISHDIPPGHYTDDTQMAISVAEWYLEGGKNYPEYLLKTFKRDIRNGYTKVFFNILNSVNNVEEMFELISGDSKKAGAAVRALPLGVARYEDNVIHYALTQAIVTHNSPEGILSAKAVALMSHYGIHKKGKIHNLSEYLNDNLSRKPFNIQWKGETGDNGLHVVLAAVTAYTRNDSLKDLLIDCVNFGGDTDTVAAIAVGAASCHTDYEKNLPQNLIDNLENGPYGKNYLIELDKKLLGHLTK